MTVGHPLKSGLPCICSSRCYILGFACVLYVVTYWGLRVFLSGVNAISTSMAISSAAVESLMLKAIRQDIYL